MERLSRSFEILFREIGIEQGVTVEIIKKQWLDLFGETLAGHTCPFACRREQLIVHVDSPEWLHELRYHHSSLLAKLKPFGFKTVHLKLGRIPKQVSKEPCTRKRRKISPEERVLIESISSSVGNDSMREQIKKAMENSIAFEIVTGKS